MTTAADIVGALCERGIEYKATRNGKFTCACPRCGEGYCNVAMGPDGAKWFCHHCDEGGGLSLNARNGKAAGAEPFGDLGPIKAIYDYTDEGGKCLFQVLRFEPIGKPKQLRQRIGPDQKKWTIKGARLVPYRLPELLEAVAKDQVVFIVEGEKKVEALRERGVVATCNAMGVGKWRDEFSAYLKGADVVIIPDNDPPGREHANKVARSVKHHAQRVRLLDLADVWRDIEASDDIYDWFAAGHDVAELWRHVEALSDRYKLENDKSGLGAGAQCDATIRSVRASAVAMKAVNWLWPNRFALGKLGLLVGLPDEGKGQLLCDIAARVTRAEQWPCAEGIAPLGNVVMLTAEDDIGDTVVPRLVAAGADLERIHFINMVSDHGKDRMFSLVTDLQALRQKIVEIGNVVLIEIDPISAYLGVGKVDSFRTTDVRAVLGPVVDLANECKAAVVGMLHFNKKTDVSNALLRISDSLAFGATARHVYGVVNDAENKRKLMVRAKNNLASAEMDRALAFRFGLRQVGTDRESGKEIWAPHIVWERQPVDVSATEAMQADNKSPAARDEAKKFLNEILANGPILKTEIEEAADANGIAERTLFRAKNELNIMAKKDGEGGAWTWRLPDKPRAPQWQD
jgi:hypothetical protein